jgi:hypothetical protein
LSPSSAAFVPSVLFVVFVPALRDAYTEHATGRDAVIAVGITNANTVAAMVRDSIISGSSPFPISSIYSEIASVWPPLWLSSSVPFNLSIAGLPSWVRVAPFDPGTEVPGDSSVRTRVDKDG